jgi:hypothetical protein
MSWKHLAGCAALIGVGVAVAVAGLELLGVLIAFACPLMMAAMVWMMVRGGARGH